jgi:NTE family protein
MKGPIRALVLGGGGAKGMVALGALHYHRSSFDLKVISGTSIGSIIGALLGCGYSPTDIMELAITFNPQLKFSFAQWTTTYGLCAVASILEPAFAAIDAKIGAKSTFKTYMDATGIDLVVCAGNVTRGVTTYFRASTHPDLELRLALAASCSVPCLFSAVEIGGELYVDGGGSDNFPHLPIPQELAPYTLGVRLIGLSSTPPPITGPVDFLLRLTVLMTSSPHQMPPEMTYLELRAPEIPFVPSGGMDAPTAKYFFDRGYKDAWSMDRTIVL